jgi:hypothetical protein
MRVYTAQLRSLSTHCWVSVRAKTHLEVHALSCLQVMRCPTAPDSSNSAFAFLSNTSISFPTYFFENKYCVPRIPFPTWVGH